MHGPILPGESAALIRSIPSPAPCSLTLPMAYYINRDSGRYKETVDEYETKEEALRILPEYQLSEHGRAYYFVSTVCRPNWKD